MNSSLVQLEIGISLAGGFLVTYVAARLEIKRKMEHYRKKYENEFSQSSAAIQVIKEELSTRKKEYDELRAKYELLAQAERRN